MKAYKAFSELNSVMAVKYGQRYFSELLVRAWGETLHLSKCLDIFLDTELSYHVNQIDNSKISKQVLHIVPRGRRPVGRPF